MKTKTARLAALCLIAITSVALGGCGAQALGACADGDDKCADNDALLTEPMPPEGYVVKRSTCANFVEGDAKLRNNSRVVAVRSDGTVPLQRAEPVANAEENFKRVRIAKLPYKLLGGEGTLRRPSSQGQPTVSGEGLGVVTSALEPASSVSFVKLGQIVATQEADGSTVQWVVGSEQLGEPVKNAKNGRLEYQDTCFRNPKLAGKDTAGYGAIQGEELAGTCVVEDVGQSYNALSVGVYTPLSNFATMAVPSFNDPAVHAHPDRPLYLGFDGTSYNYSGMGAALNDINGAERDVTTNYYGLDSYCHMIVNGGLEVPGAKRPATKSLPPPGAVNSKTFIVWRAVNPNVNIANDELAIVPDRLEPAPPVVDVPVDAADAILPM
jgi:hypothetical protein